MEVEIQNLGAINHAQIDLKPLSVFIGENSTGKTWTAYTISCIFSVNSFINYEKLFNSESLPDKYPFIENIINDILTKGNSKIDMQELCDSILIKYLNNVATNINGELKQFFSTSYASFDDLKITIHLNDDELIAIKRNIIKQSFTWLLSPDLKGKAKLRMYKEDNDKFLYIYSEVEKKNNLLPKKIIDTFVYENIFYLMYSNFSRNRIVFPSERTGFSTLSLINYSKSSNNAKHYQKAGDENPRIKHTLPYPIGDLLDITSGFLTLENPEEVLKKRKKNSSTSDLVFYGELFQKELLHGSLNKSKPSDEILAEVLYKYENNVELDMSTVSSMVKASSPFVIYLKYFAEKGDLIVIDEPEMNLHPKAQAQFAEFLGILMNFGLKIIITTHSTFFVDHFVNLIKASRKRNKRIIEPLFYLKTKKAFIPQKYIGAYLFENNTVKNILNEEGFINWDTFSVISEHLSNIYFKMDDKYAI